MAKFLEGNELNLALENIFLEAEEQLILISPYIKFHARDLDALREKKNKPKVKLTIVFGKNENDISKSIGFDDIEFLKDFPNIEIRYESRLHAKYYTNEKTALLTSMNLLDYSQNNNIEVGILMNSNLFNALANFFIDDTIDARAATYFKKVVENAEILFQKIPEYDGTLLGLAKKYKSSRIEKDLLSKFLIKKQRADAQLFLNKDKNKFDKPFSKITQFGYCIRTGVKIPFNIKRPMGDEAYASWVKFKNENYPEKFCHFSGEESYGKTSIWESNFTKKLRESERFSLAYFNAAS